MVGLLPSQKKYKGRDLMRKKIAVMIFISLFSVILTGCWDILYLTNKKIINGISLDVTKDSSMMGMVRAVVLKSKGGGQFEVKDEVLQTTGDSVFNIGLKMDNMLPGTIEASKIHVIIIGEKLAKQGILSPLEGFYRNPKGNLTSNVLISEGLASDILSFENIENSPVAYGIMQMIKGAERKTNIQNQNLYSIWNQITDPGEDAMLPMIRKIKDKALVIDSTGLFHGDKYTGTMLSREESTILLLLKDKLNKLAYIEIPVKMSSGLSKPSEKEISAITFEVQKLQRSLEVSVKKNTQDIDCLIKLDLYGTINSFPSYMGQKINIDQLNQEIAETLNKQAIEVTNKLLKANCDALGIGRRLRVSHSELWKSINWENKYKEVKLNPNIQVHIRGTGVIN